MSDWKEHALEEKIEELLDTVPYYETDHHFGRPFITAYQLAILFKERFPSTYESLGHPIGGRGSGEPYSLPTYLARQLSQQIKNHKIRNIEGRWFFSERQRLKFDCDSQQITASSNFVSMFRLKDEV